QTLCQTDQTLICPNELILLRIPIISEFTINYLSYTRINIETGMEESLKSYTNYRLTLATEAMTNLSITSPTISFIPHGPTFSSTGRTDIFSITGLITEYWAPGFNHVANNNTIWRQAILYGSDPDIAPRFDNGDLNIGNRYDGQPETIPDPDIDPENEDSDEDGNDEHNNSEANIEDESKDVFSSDQAPPATPPAPNAISSWHTLPLVEPIIATEPISSAVAATSSEANSRSPLRLPDYQTPLAGVIGSDSDSPSLLFLLYSTLPLFLLLSFFIFLIWKRQRDNKEEKENPYAL
ncbi:hypothetical protein FWH09_02385, partial [Candidatus Saccharibacteria bacterium]|nr:hypothetical protein [Candidatus Saccharibacteria bacterium]